MTPFERQVRHAIYASFQNATSTPSPESIAHGLSSPLETVKAALQALADAHALVLQPGTHEIWMAHPFSGIKTDFVVTVGDRQWFANCVWDGLSILGLFGDGRLDTHCPASQTPLRFDVQDGRVSGEGVVHFLVPASRFWDDIGFT